VIAVLSSKLFFKSVLIFNSFMVLLPVFFLFNSALRETNSFASNPFSLAKDPHWENFSQVWSDGAFATYLKNSLIVTGGSLVVILVCALGAGFILGRYQFKGSTIIFGFILTGMLIPAKLAILPLFIQLMSALDRVEIYFYLHSSLLANANQLIDTDSKENYQSGNQSSPDCVDANEDNSDTDCSNNHCSPQ